MVPLKDIETNYQRQRFEEIDLQKKFFWKENAVKRPRLGTKPFPKTIKFYVLRGAPLKKLKKP